MEKYSKQSDNEWLFTSYEKADDPVTIESIGFTFKVNSLYRNVSFDEE